MEYTVAHPEVITALQKVTLQFAVNALAPAAALASLTAGDVQAARYVSVTAEPRGLPFRGAHLSDDLRLAVVA